MKNTAIAKKVIKEAAKNGYDQDKGFRQIGIVVDRLSAGQLAYSAIQGANQYMENNFGTNISIFCLENAPACLEPHFAIYNTKDIRSFTGDVIATSTKSMIEATKAVRCRKFWYVYDVEWLRPHGQNIEKAAEVLMAQKDIVKFARSEIYRKMLIDRGYNVDTTIVPDFDIDTIIQLLEKFDGN